MILNERTYAVHTFGCKVNHYETAALTHQLRQEGCLPASEGDADIVLVNSCTVTKRTDYQVRQLVRRIRRHNPHCLIVLFGCYAQIAPKELEILDRRLIVYPSGQKELLVERLKTSEQDRGIISFEKETIARSFAVKSVKSPDRTRAFLKIQDGCKNFCSYCIIPYARGVPRSATFSSVISAIGELEREGVKEVVLSGVHVGSYGRDLVGNGFHFAALIKEIAKFTSLRFRLSSLDPRELTDEVIGALKDCPNFCTFLHIPLQSGDERILKSMGRGYTLDEYDRIVHALKNQFPGLCLGSDLIVGFPGEDRSSFARTLAYLKQAPIDHLHVFRYSKRPGTKAAMMADQVQEQEKSERAARLTEIGRRKKRGFIESQIGRTLHCLFESGKKTGQVFRGYTENYIALQLQSEKDLNNILVPMVIETIDDLKMDELDKPLKFDQNHNRITSGSPDLGFTPGRESENATINFIEEQRRMKGWVLID